MCSVLNAKIKFFYEEIFEIPILFCISNSNYLSYNAYTFGPDSL